MFTRKGLKFIIALIGSLEVYSEPNQTSKLELFAKTISSFQPITIFAKSLPSMFIRVLNTRLFFYLFLENSLRRIIFSRNSSGAFVTVDQVLQEFLFI